MTTAQLDGSNVQMRCQLNGSLVAKDASHLYYTVPHTSGNDTLGRTNLDCSHDDPNFLPVTISRAVTVDSAHLYWTSSNGIGRANLDGSNIDPNFISGPTDPGAGLAVDSGHIYWATISPSLGSAIARADISGSHVAPRWLPISSEPLALTVDSTHVYWIGTPGIGRANLDGSGSQDPFLATGGAPQAEGNGLAVDGAHIYWGMSAGLSGSGSVGRANLDGSGSNPNFISGQSYVGSVLVDGLSASTPTSTLSCPVRVRVVFDADAGAFDPLPQWPSCTVTIAGGAAGPPSGTVTFSYPGALTGDGADTCQLKPAGATSSSCTAPEPLAHQAADGRVSKPGTIPFTARYGGASDYLPVTSPRISDTTYTGPGSPTSHGGGRAPVASLRRVSVHHGVLLIWLACGHKARRPCVLLVDIQIKGSYRTISSRAITVTLRPGQSRMLRERINVGRTRRRVRHPLSATIRVTERSRGGNAFVGMRSVSLGGA